MTALPSQRSVSVSVSQVMYGLPSSDGASHASTDCPPDGTKEKHVSTTLIRPSQTSLAVIFRPS